MGDQDLTIWIPIEAQQALAKLQEMKRCLSVSSF
uniref:Uncharacterized protein n=1 Tax=Arundo donax TaxID=35708 RepID=A0A0A9H5K5_ARUDO